MSLRWFGLTPLLWLASVHGQTQYVTDRFFVELRRGPSLEYLILRNLQSGQAVEVLEQDTESGYSRVRVVDQGTEGWLLTRFVQPEPIARDRLAMADQKLGTAGSRATELERQVTDLTVQLELTRKTLAETAAEKDRVGTELADLTRAAADVVALKDDNVSLRQQLVERDRDLERLTLETSTLGSRAKQSWFIVGAGVLLGGMIVGLVAPSLGRKRRSDW